MADEKVTSVTESLKNIEISDGSVASITPSTESNPWHDASSGDPSGKPEAAELHLTESKPIESVAAFANITSAGSEAERNARTEEVLNEFDPLIHREEQAAREAWAQAEGHPPPPPAEASTTAEPSLTTDAASPETPPKDVASSTAPAQAQPIPDSFAQKSARSSGSNFPSLASLARTFTIPNIARARPMSIDTATAVPSPNTLSSMADQHTQLPHDPETSFAVDRPSTPDNNGASSSRNGKDKEEPAFDFQKFLDQMKMKGADAVGKYLRSFLGNFAKRTFTVNDQVKIINDFLNFISMRMRESDVWRQATDIEFDHAMEGMEKLVMNRLYDFTFTPAVVRVIPPRPITADDLERDRVLSQRIALFGWIEEKHLDIPEGEGSKGFIMFGQQELLKINHYKAPRDKLICILNCCKVIFGLIRHLHKDEGADSFVPILIFIVLKANPENLLSNVEFINRFRNPSKLQSEAGYYLSSLMGAVSFIETMDHTSLSNITQEEFGNNVEEAIQSLPSEPHTPFPSEPVPPSTPKKGMLTLTPQTPVSPHAGEESARPLALPTPSQTLGEDARRLLQKTGDTISKPLSAIGRIFSEALEEAEEKLINLRQEPQSQDESGQSHWAYPGQVGPSVPQTPIGVGESGQQVGAYGAPLQTPYKPRIRRGNSPSGTPTSPSMQSYPDETPSRPPPRQQSLNPHNSQAIPPPRVPTTSRPTSQHVSRTPTPNLDFAGMQSEIDQAHEKAMGAARETLVQIFPTVDNEVIEWVLEANAGDLGKSIEGLLEMSSGS